MKLLTLAAGEPWMTREESELNRELVGHIDELLRDRGVGENPLLSLRVNDVVVSWLLARRLEQSLTPQEGIEPALTTPAQADAIGKSRERLRKSIRELEDYCTRAGTPIDTGLADIMKPVIQQVQGPDPFYGSR